MPTTVTVKDGHSLQLPDKTYMPGESVELESKEAKRLIGAGIVSTSTTKQEPPATGSASMNVKDAAVHIKSLETAGAIDAFLSEGEERKGVLDAAQARKDELTKAE